MSDVRHHEGPNEGLGAVRMTKLTIPATITHIDQRDAARLEELYRIPRRKLGRILEYKCGAERRSEAFTTRVGEKISPRVGLDVHKCSAAAFALKVLDYEAFKALRSPSGGIPRGAAPNEGDGSPRCRLSAGSGPTAPHQTQGLVRDEVLSDGGYPEIPGIRGLSFLESLKTGLPCLRVKIC
jgi:hypothetical protein